MIIEIKKKDLYLFKNFDCDIGLPFKSKKILEWKYFSNPCGKGKIFISMDNYNKILGVLCYLPRIFKNSSNSTFKAYQAVDAYVSPEARGKSVYSNLVKYSTKSIDAPIFGFPNSLAEKIEIKCGWEIYAPIETYIFPCNVTKLPLKILTRFPSQLNRILFNILISMRVGHRSPKIIMSKVTKFDPLSINFDNYFKGNRSQAYLNWRFAENPINKYTLFQFTYDQGIIGYAALLNKGSSVEIYDFQTNLYADDCIYMLLKYCHNKSYSHVIAQTLNCDFSKLGFLKIKSKRNLISYGIKPKNIVISFGDSDWE